MALSCPVCGVGRAEPRLVKQGVDIWFCGACGLGFWRPDEGFDARGLYGAGYFGGSDLGPGYDDYGALEAALRANFARRLRRLGPSRPGARLLDLGPAFGYAVDEARRVGFRAVGLEISRAAAARAARTLRAGGVVVGDAQRTPFATARFDVVTIWDVLEHLPDPHAAMAEVARLLRPGGRLALSTGDVGSWVARLSGPRWHLYTIPEHLFFYSRESLRRLLAGHGFQVRDMRAEGARYPLGYLVERLRKTCLRRGARAPARWPGAGLAVPINLFDVVTVHAVRDDR